MTPSDVGPVSPGELLRADRAGRRFGDVVAVEDVTMSVRAGEVVGLLGANGAGKTTLIRMLLGLIATSAGEVALLGGPPDRVRRTRLGYVPQGLGLYGDLTVRENLTFSAQAYGSTAPRLPEALLVIDPHREKIAVTEARKLGIKVVALLDTDCDPDVIDLPIPGNDDSIRSIEVVVSKLADACLEGRAALPPEQQAMIKPRQTTGKPAAPAAEANPAPAPAVS